MDVSVSVSTSVSVSVCQRTEHIAAGVCHEQPVEERAPLPHQEHPHRAEIARILHKIRANRERGIVNTWKRRYDMQTIITVLSNPRIEIGKYHRDHVILDQLNQSFSVCVGVRVRYAIKIMCA